MLGCINRLLLLDAASVLRPGCPCWNKRSVVVAAPPNLYCTFQEEFAPWNKHGSYSSIGNSSGSSTRDSRLEVDSTTSDSSFTNLGLDQYGNWVQAAAASRRPAADFNAITRQLRELSTAAEPVGGRPESGFVSLQSLQSSASGASRAPAAASPQASPRPPAAPAPAAAPAQAAGDVCDSPGGGGGEHTVTLSVPPALPPKRRSQRGPPLGHYDNVPPGGVSASCSLDGVVLRHRRHWHDADDSRPPPLPMKKKHGTSHSHSHCCTYWSWAGRGNRPRIKRYRLGEGGQEWVRAEWG